MRYVESLGVAWILFIFAVASPVNLQSRAGDFIVHQTIPKPFKKSGPAAMLSTYGKFNACAPEDVIKAATANDGTVSASPAQYDSEYLSPVTVGGQTLNLNFDTGSSDLWVFSSELPAPQSNGHSIYDPALSSTSKVMNGSRWSILYGDFSGATGDVYADTVKIGTTTVTGQAVELARTISTAFRKDVDNDGILGLAFDTINTVRPVKQQTFFSNAKSSLSAPLFTANLKKGKPGTYTFGYVDASQYNGPITYVPVNSTSGFWQFTCNGYAVGTTAFNSSSIDAIADTGTSLVYLPDAIVKAYYANVPNAHYNRTEGGYIYPCSATLPSFTLGIGSYKAVIPGSYITYSAGDNNTCFGGIQSNNGLGHNIIGGTFLKAQFVVFQSSPLQLGFAPKPL
ncbi:MAG: hypothetical protein Q9171_000630 [Xanthocarpia ochracea]